MELKETLLMPHTGFEMRGNLSIKEPILVKNWADMDLYSLMNTNRKDAKEFMLHDGPPYANGNIHCGHMMNRILKDIIVRYKNMAGFKTPFVMGWDTHGLPIENMVIKSGVNRKTTPIVEFREKCYEYALKQVANQKEQMLRLGVLADTAHPYLTLHKEFEAKQVELFAKMALNGLIYKGLKPVYWSPSSETALAEAEIEYADVTSHSIYVAFEVKDGKGVIDADARVVIWTTTPWTLPANLAVSANPKFTYGEYSTDKGKLCFLVEFLDKLTEELDLKDVKLIKTFTGKDIEGVILKHPFYERDSIMLNGEHVTNESGTGFVHTAPGHGLEDYEVCQRYGIAPYCPVDSRGYMMEDTGPGIAGLFYEDANDAVLKIIGDNGALLKHETIVHSYPHDWRTGKPLIFRATPQWFCSIEPIRKKIIEQIHKVNWKPAWGETRMVNMIKDRADWTISRQRAWGVPITIIYCEDGTPIIDEKVFAYIIELIKENGSNIWYKLSAKELLPEGYTNEHSPHNEFTKEKDIMDVWFDSGSSWDGVLLARGMKYPADLYLEGSDQYRGWFNSSLILSVANEDVAPYKNILSHGFVMDDKWEKMSKSKGNGIDPIKIANVYGADILRLWTATIDYQQDVRISESIIKQVSEVYRKIRNTFKFMLGNISDFDINHVDVEYEKVDKFILAKLEEVKNVALKAIEEYDFGTMMSSLVTFISTDLSSFYLDITKDVLYCDAKDDPRRIAVMSVYYQVAETLMRLLNPIIPFTMEEVNKFLPGVRKESSQLYDYPTKSEIYSKELLEEYSLFIKLRVDVLKALEEARSAGIIGSSQEASVEIAVLDSKYSLIFANISNVETRRLFVVSDLQFVDNLDESKIYEVSKVKVVHHSGVKCDRCWNYSNDSVEIDGHHLCKRCQKVLGE
jgi:isoleucyl-tRNA synthetase